MKRIITDYENRRLSVLMDESGIITADVLKKDTFLGNIYCAKVKNIVPNINAAFVDIGGTLCYYSLLDNKKHFFLNKKTDNKLSTSDSILIQIEKEAIKTKLPCAVSKFSLQGNFCVVMYHSNGIGISNKITDETTRKILKEWAEPFSEKDFGIIVRTNAKNASQKELISEIQELKNQLKEILQKAVYSSDYSLVYQAHSLLVSQIMGDNSSIVSEVTTDIDSVFETLKPYLAENNPEKNCRLTKYQGEIPLYRLYQFEKRINELLSKNVWLKSGGFLVIEQTEALTVIDVNTGKSIGKQNQEEYLLKINKEACRMIARQIQARNISGIIIIDFINMEEKEHNEELLSYLKSICINDSQKTKVIDMTPLGLVEMTRKKQKPPFSQQWNEK